MSIMENLDRLRGKVHTAVDLARREFWGLYQDDGKRTDYEYAFYGTGWTDKRFKPYYELGSEDYPIEYANSMFYASRISDVGTIVLADECEVVGMFQFSTAIRRAHIHIIGALIDCENMFSRCDNLTDLTIEGTIYADINLQWGKTLTEDSLRSIVNALQDLYEVGEEFAYTIKFSADSMQILSDTGLLTELEAKGWDY